MKMVDLAQMWDFLGKLAIGFSLGIFVLGFIVSSCVFIGKVWEHVNTPPSSITAEKITLEGPTTLSNNFIDLSKGGKVEFVGGEEVIIKNNEIRSTPNDSFNGKADK